MTTMTTTIKLSRTDTDNKTDTGWSKGEKTFLNRSTSERYRIGFVGPEQSGRKETGGPMVPGPWAFAYGLCVVINNRGGSGAESARRLAEGNEIEFDFGDVFEIEGVQFCANVAHNGNLELTPV